MKWFRKTPPAQPTDLPPDAGQIAAQVIRDRIAVLGQEIEQAKYDREKAAEAISRFENYISQHRSESRAAHDRECKARNDRASLEILLRSMDLDNSR